MKTGWWFQRPGYGPFPAMVQGPFLPGRGLIPTQAPRISFQSGWPTGVMRNVGGTIRLTNVSNTGTGPARSASRTSFFP
jgi:hypothetical protein